LLSGTILDPEDNTILLLDIQTDYCPHGFFNREVLLPFQCQAIEMSALNLGDELNLLTSLEVDKVKSPSSPLFLLLVEPC
jgi:hypothetical protein